MKKLTHEILFGVLIKAFPVCLIEFSTSFAIFRFDHRMGFACLQVEASSRDYRKIRVDPLTKLDPAL